MESKGHHDWRIKWLVITTTRWTDWEPKSAWSDNGKDFGIFKGKREKVKSFALKAEKEYTDDETSTLGSEDEEYKIALGTLKSYFRGELGLLDNPAMKISHLEKFMMTRRVKVKEML